jgi:RNA polymerase sigma factor (sigma-70 family)
MVQSDESLISDCCAGQREAFEVLVRRYQSYVASIVYNATGDLTRSEEITQQAFITAWRRLSDLRDPARLAAWLAGIARNLISRDFRKQKRETCARTKAALNSSIQQPTPLECAISHEQQQMLWSILEHIPSNYREPLILYYREQNSVAEVARLMQLSEDAVKQRLARGRNMIRVEVARFVEETLAETRPGSRFTASVLVSLPSGSVAGNAAIGTGIIKVLSTISSASLGTIIGVAGGIVGAVAGVWNSLRLATSQSERRFIWTYTILCFAFIIGELATVFMLVLCFRSLLFSVTFWMLIGFIYILSIFMTVIIGNRQLMKIKMKHGTAEEKHDIEQFDMVQYTIGKTMPLFPEHVWLLSPLIIYIFVIFILALIAFDWIGALGLACVGVLSVALYWRPAKNARDASSQWKLFVKIMWTSTFVTSTALLLRGEYWLTSLMPYFAAHYPGWVKLILVINVAFILLLSLFNTIGMRLSAIKPNRMQSKDDLHK